MIFKPLKTFLNLRLSVCVAIVCGLFPQALTAQTSDPSYVQNPAAAVTLRSIADWSTQHPFINVARTGRAWFGHLEGRWGGISNEQLRATGHVNENGWPVAIPDNATKLDTLIFTSQPADLHSIRGRYRLTYEGDVDIVVSGPARSITQSGNEIWFEFPENVEGPIGIGLTRINPDDPLRSLDIVHEDNILAHEVGAIFNPNWIDKIKDFRVLRMMGWMKTNDSTVKTWTDLPKVGDFSYTHGVPLEVMIDLSNFVGADPWFSIPHMADDDLVQKFAEAVHRDLAPERHAYVEYSNEVWNFQFEQTRWADEQAKLLWKGRAGGDTWIQFAGLRAAQIAGIFSDEFAEDRDEKLVNVVAVHTAWTDLADAQLTGNLIKRVGEFDPAEVFDAYAVTGYLNPEFEQGKAAETLNGWLEKGGKSLVFQNIQDRIKHRRLKSLESVYWPEHLKRADKYGLDLVMYEGGTHVIFPYDEPVDQALVDLLIEFNYSPQMIDLYKDLFDAWESAGGELFNVFSDIYSPGRYGSWGHLRHLDDDNTRWDAVTDQNRNGAVSEIRPENAFADGVHSTTISGASVLRGTDFHDILIGNDGDDTIFSGTGNDRIHGGDGVDQLMLSDSIDDYVFKKIGQKFTATRAEQQTHFASIEYVFFEGDGVFVATTDLIEDR